MLRVTIILIVLSFETNIFAQDNYFLTLRFNEVNLRQGPSKEYPVKIFYKKKFLPVLVREKSDNFRKIIDHENNTGWIHISQLSKKKAAIIIEEDSLIFRRPTIYSTPLAVLKKGRLVRIMKCKDVWCKIKSGKYKGWVEKKNLWGRL